MKKQRRKSQASRKASSQSAPHEAVRRAKPALDRRRVLMLARNWGIAAAVLGGIGYVSVGSVMATHAELDLTRIGQGVPTVVQVHDPSCRLCQQLQTQTRDALRAFSDDDLVYLVANIRTDQGRRLAARHSAPHVTLLLFDGRGQLRDTITGVTPSETLEARFTRHLAISRRVGS